MSRMVNDLLTLAQAEAGEIRLDFAPVALDELAADLVDQMKPLAEDRAVRLEMDAAGRVVARGNEPRLRQLVLNLLDNAIKYTPAGGHIRVAVSREDDAALLTISDTGIGIPPGDLPRVFERFYRVDRARSKTVEGVGLGLSIAKWIVDAHGGEIKVESAPGQGTTFRIQFPLVTEAARVATATR
jgi:signal transduction histidine kinase